MVAVEPVQYEVRNYENQSAQPYIPAIERYAGNEILAFEVMLNTTETQTGD